LIFLVRSATRIAPSGVLSFLYNKDRVKVKGL
jgi:amylovoran biosynthesis glycosyltransferase AmsE